MRRTTAVCAALLLMLVSYGLGRTDVGRGDVHAADGDCQTFTQTGKSACGEFLAYWKANGGLAQQGFPISDVFSEKSETDGNTYQVQYYERAVFEMHPELPAGKRVLLTLLGSQKYKTRYNGTQPSGTPVALAASVTGTPATTVATTTVATTAVATTIVATMAPTTTVSAATPTTAATATVMPRATPTVIPSVTPAPTATSVPLSAIGPTGNSLTDTTGTVRVPLPSGWSKDSSLIHGDTTLSIDGPNTTILSVLAIQVDLTLAEATNTARTALRDSTTTTYYPEPTMATTVSGIPAQTFTYMGIDDTDSTTYYGQVWIVVHNDRTYDFVALSLNQSLSGVRAIMAAVQFLDN